MVHISLTELRQDLDRYMDEAADSRAPLLVTRQDGKGSVVILSEREFEAWQETVHLLGNPANAQHLLASIHAADAGHTEECGLVRPDRNAGV